MKGCDRKDASSLLIAFIAIAAIPLSLFVMRSRPLSAESPGELLALARETRQDEILSRMSRRYEGMSLNFEGPDPGENPEIRWLEIKNSIVESGAEPVEAKQIVGAAQTKLTQAWPCLAERGYLKGKSVWIVVGSSPTNTGPVYWACLPGADAIRQEKITRYCTNAQIALINAEVPYQILN